MTKQARMRNGEWVTFHGVFQVEYDNFKSPMAVVEYENGVIKKEHLHDVVVGEKDDKQLKIEE